MGHKYFHFIDDFYLNYLVINIHNASFSKALKEKNILVIPIETSFHLIPRSQCPKPPVQLEAPKEKPQSCTHHSFQRQPQMLQPYNSLVYMHVLIAEYYETLCLFKTEFMQKTLNYSGSWKILTLDVREGPASSIFSSSFAIPASATWAMKSSSTKTLAVLKFLCTIGGFRPCKWHNPAKLETQI